VPARSFAGPDKTDEELRREAAMADFTRRTREANNPAIFEKAAVEFNVPADVLKGIAFAETRWEHLIWPPGENFSPENGKPRPFGIMALWDNESFGRSLIEAAGLIGRKPEELKLDPTLNTRGAAALLRRIYDQNPKPEGTTEADIESWRYAIRKYCGIPEADLNAQHALKVYTFMTQGYHQFGIEWDARPVNLEPIRAETFRIVSEERAKRAVALAAAPNLQAAASEVAAPKTAITPGPEPASPGLLDSAAAGPSDSNKRLWVGGLFAALALVIAIVFRRRKQPQ
jgi:hypothetical protein